MTQAICWLGDLLELASVVCSVESREMTVERMDLSH